MVTLTPKQNAALKILKKNILDGERITVLQGYAGTGKSTVLSFLMEELDYESEQVVFCCFTGSATRLLQRKGLNAQTIHSLIYEPIVKRGVCIGFRKRPWMELSHLALIVVDEFSMVSDELMTDLQSFGIPLLLVGDQAQLSAIGAANKYINYYDAHLDEVMRQALDNPILWAATKLRQGEILKEGTYGDILFVGRQLQVQEEWKRKDVQFITGTNATRNKINLEINGSPNIGLNDKIIFLKNDWDEGVINGTISNIKFFRKGAKAYILDFVDEMGIAHNEYIAYFQQPPTQRDQYFDWAYCLTSTKSQGQTFDCPGVIIDDFYVFREDKIKHQYVALTRFTGNYPVAFLR